jgi:preprotein translocase subunit SecB
MKQNVTQDQHSALQFERVWVREAVFIDDEASQVRVPSQDIHDLGLTLEVRVTFSDKRDRAMVILRASLEPPSSERYFVKLSAAVEGAFRVAGGTEEGRLEKFASLQAPVLLLPYLRQVFSELTAQSRLGALVLPPINMADVIQAMEKTSEKAPTKV